MYSETYKICTLIEKPIIWRGDALVWLGENDDRAYIR
jgi:hypothetical protein